MRPLVIYIHGFLSSPRSQKAEETRLYLQAQRPDIEFLAPDLSNYPQHAYQQLTELIELQRASRPVALIGSSLGGFMATALAEQFALRAVLVNPAVQPYTLIEMVLGENVNPYSGQQFLLEPHHIDELKAIEPAFLSCPQNLLILVQTGDETLDYRDAVKYYADCPQVVEPGGDHRFQNYEKHLPQLIKFLELA